MKNKKNVFVVLLLASFINLNAQNFDLPPNPENGKCYKRCFHYDKEIEWKEIECPNKSSETILTSEKLKSDEEEIVKIRTYQELLKSLGYDIDINGIIDNKTIIAHHHYLKEQSKKAKAEKKASKKNS